MSSLFVVYILFSLRYPRTYVGYTSDLTNRLAYHNSGKVHATKYLKPWRVIYQETSESIQKAKERELYWKSAAGRRNIKIILKGFPPHFREMRRGSSQS